MIKNMGSLCRAHSSGAAGCLDQINAKIKINLKCTPAIYKNTVNGL